MAAYLKDTPGAPVGRYRINDTVTDSVGTVWVCVVGGRVAQFDVQAAEAAAGGGIVTTSRVIETDLLFVIDATTNFSTDLGVLAFTNTDNAAVEVTGPSVSNYSGVAPAIGAIGVRCNGDGGEGQLDGVTNFVLNLEAFDPDPGVAGAVTITGRVLLDINDADGISYFGLVQWPGSPAIINPFADGVPAGFYVVAERIGSTHHTTMGVSNGTDYEARDALASGVDSNLSYFWFRFVIAGAGDSVSCYTSADGQTWALSGAAVLLSVMTGGFYPALHIDSVGASAAAARLDYLKIEAALPRTGVTE